VNKHITIYDIRTTPGDPPESLGEFVHWIQEKYESIPEEFRESGVLDMYADDNSLYFEIRYSRPETEEEEATRLRTEKARVNAQRERDLVTLQRLKDIYEPKTP
jgi:hypothetical protein